MTEIKYKDDNGWMTYQDMTGIKMSIRKMRLEQEGLNDFKEALEFFSQVFSVQTMPSINLELEGELHIPSIEDLLGVNSKYELGQI